MNEYTIKTTEDKALMFYHYETQTELSEIKDTLNKVCTLLNTEYSAPPKIKVEDMRCYLMMLGDIKEKLESLRKVLKTTI